MTIDEQVRMAKISGHPLRVAILQELGSGVASPNALRLSLNEQLGDVSYHVAVLRDLGALELVDTQPRRGAVEHFYRVAPGLALPAAGLELTSAQRQVAARYLEECLYHGAVEEGGHGYNAADEENLRAAVAALKPKEEA